MGTPEFAVPGLSAIAASPHNIKLVVTGRDKAVGRGRKFRGTPVKQQAIHLNLPVSQPESLKSPEFIGEIASLGADVIVVVAFRILPSELINAARLGAINLHASLLPKYRGAAPINWAIINGEKETGYTIFQIKPRIDTGDILMQEAVPISERDTYGDLYERLSRLGAPALVRTLDGLEKGTLTAIPQKDSLATKAPKIYPEMGAIIWSDPAESIKNRIHGLSPSPGAYTHYGKKRIKIFRADYTRENGNYLPGTIGIRDKKRLGIQTGAGMLFPLELQMEGKKVLPADEFLRGFPGRVGDSFQS